jgi:hypothetical protein
LGRAADTVDNRWSAERAQMGLVVLPVAQSLGILAARIRLLSVRDVSHNKQVTNNVEKRSERSMAHEIRRNPELQEWFCARCGRTSDHLRKEDAEIEIVPCEIYQHVVHPYRLKDKP